MESAGCIHDRYLVREAQGGNHRAFAQLVHAHDEGVLKLAIRITGSQSDAQDIYQETFLKVYKGLAGFQFHCSFSTWIYRIAINACLDHLRKNRNRRKSNAIQVNADGEEYDLLNQISENRVTHNPEQEFLRREISASILCALQTLTPQERMVVDLKHYQGFNLRAVSEILNTSERSVKIILSRATRKLYLHLAMCARPRTSSIKQYCNDGA
jgi:RNA polymerase sigma-70 factor (ECF subfamily)